MTSTAAGRRSRAIAALIACFYAGAVADWWLRERATGAATAFPPIVSGLGRTADPSTMVFPSTGPGAGPSAGLGAGRLGGPRGGPTARPVATTGEPTMSSGGSPPGEAVGELLRRDLRLPIDGASVEAMKGSFVEHRSGAGGHEHDAVDILAPRNTPIRAVEDGTIAKLFYSQAGGTTVYQFDPSQRFCYYYAHLERYADGLRDGQKVSRGDVIGYVGTSGNAPPGTPHLHFAVYELTPEHRWWQGRAIDPYLAFRH